MMKKVAEKYFTKEILHQGASAFNIELNSLKELSGFENFIYSGEIEGTEVVIRYCHSSHRTIDQIKAELDWLVFLKKHGASVCAPLISKQEETVEIITSQNTKFFVSVFEKANGTHIKIEENIRNTELFYEWGKATGELHRLTMSYIPSNGIVPREDYMDSSLSIESLLDFDHEVKQEFKILSDKIISLPKTKNNYLLSHTDLHSGNFFYDKGQLWIFDFDDCAYNYLAHDLAMPIYYVLWNFKGSVEEFKSFGEFFFTQFLTGYFTENDLSYDDIKHIPLFMKFRDIVLYAVLNHEWDEDEINKRKDMMRSFKERIISNKTLIELPYEKIYKSARK